MSILQKTHLKKIGKDLLAYANTRRDIIKQTGDALHLSKRAIFAMHRDNIKEAKTKTAKSESFLPGIQATA